MSLHGVFANTCDIRVRRSAGIVSCLGVAYATRNACSNCINALIWRLFVLQQREEQGVVIAELLEHGQQVIVARGGRGGRGNADRPDPAPGMASDDRERGEPGEVTYLLLETKTMADVGFVGLPNTGMQPSVNCRTC